MEYYNETKTKKILKNIKESYTKKISYNAIYMALGAHDHKENNYSSSKYDICLCFPIIHAQTDYDNYKLYINNIGSISQSESTYYHFRISKSITASERMIINLQSQDDTIKLVRNLFSTLYSSNTKNCISSLKFLFGKIDPNKKIKYDKIVIYYNTTDRATVCKLVYAAARNSKVYFLKDNSAFYHIASVSDSEEKKEQDKYLVGIGVEISGTSFTTERAKEIFKFMTGKSVAKNMDATEEAYYYDDMELVNGGSDNIPIRDEILQMDTNKFVEDAYNLCVKYCKPFK